MDDKKLKEIREKISCPQLGDEHYGEWGILNMSQRREIKRMLDYIDAQEEYIRTLHKENKSLKRQINALLENAEIDSTFKVLEGG